MNTPTTTTMSLSRIITGTIRQTNIIRITSIIRIIIVRMINRMIIRTLMIHHRTITTKIMINRPITMVINHQITLIPKITFKLMIRRN